MPAEILLLSDPTQRLEENPAEDQVGEARD